jgi:hypothetical protein
MEAAMPLIYLPLIMYASWMECMAQPFVGTSRRAGALPTDSDRPIAALKPIETARHKL